MKDLSIYVNFPFCRQKCHFCDWVQRVPKSDLFLKAEDSVRKNYVDALCKEIVTLGSELSEKGYMPKIIYWGGGTATTAVESEIDQITAALRKAFDLSAVKEWTIEGSPDTVDVKLLSYFRQHGFNRFSFGVQSFNEERLKKLARRHNRQQSLDAIHIAREAGFKNISIDLMCGFIDETLEEVAQNMEVVTEMGIKQLSFYTFRPTEGTMLRRQIDKKNAPKNFALQQIKSYEFGRNLLTAQGYQEYGLGYFGEIAQNVVAMFSLQCDVVGFGSGAVSVLEKNYCGHTSGKLHSYIENPLSYDFKVPVVSSPGVLLSLLRSGLSIYDGITKDLWLERFGETMDQSLLRDDIRELVSILKNVGDLKITADRIYLPSKKAPIALIGLINGSMLAKRKEADIKTTVFG